jgi:hypothetical protein
VLERCGCGTHFVFGSRGGSARFVFGCGGTRFVFGCRE